jgi:hypothetical protein
MSCVETNDAYISVDVGSSTLLQSIDGVKYWYGNSKGGKDEGDKCE